MATVSFCTQCGADVDEIFRLKKVAKAAAVLIDEGRVEDNMDGVVAATNKLIDALGELHSGVDTGGLGALQ